MNRLLATLCLTAAVAAQHTPARVAIYRDVGVWPNEGSRALPAVFEWLGTTYRFVSAADVNAGVLHQAGKPAFDLLVVPGGWAADYVSRVGGWNGQGRGDDEVRAFLARGGNYLGFCAGAFATANTTRWLGRNYAYPWKIFDGVAEGPLPWNRLIRGRLRAGHGTAVLDNTTPELKGRGLPKTVRPMLYGGPRFLLRDPKSPPAGYRVLAQHGEDGSAAIVSFRYPDAKGGRVVLSSFHPSVLTDDAAAFDRDHPTFAADGAGRDPDGHVPDWQLVTALIDVALGRAPRKAPPLPKAAGTVSVPAALAIGRSHPMTLSQPGSAGADYLLAASLSTVPGIPIADRIVLPLSADVVLFASLGTPSVFAKFAGSLDANARATATLHVPAIQSLRGTTLHFAFVTRNKFGWVATSAPASTTLR